MAKSIKIILISLLILSTLSLLVISACSEKTATPEATKTAAPITTPVTIKPATETTKTASEKAPPGPDELSKIVLNSAQATLKVDTLKYLFQMSISMNVTGGSQPAKVNLEVSGNGSENRLNHNSLLKLKTGTSMGTGTSSNPKIEINMDMYTIDNMLYMNIVMPFGGMWTKTKFTDALQKKFNLNMADEQLKLLNSPSKLAFLRYEKIGDSSGYVMQITPTAETLSNWMNAQQSSGSTNVDWGKLDISKAFKNMVFICWIAEDNKYLIRMDCDVLADLSYQDIGATIKDFEKMTMGIKMSINFYDYNKAFSIVLPPEAAGAIEVSPDSLLK